MENKTSYTVKLLPKQKEAFKLLLDQSNTELLYGGGAGGGKSWFGCMWVTMQLLQYVGARAVIAREELKALKQTTVLTLLEEIFPLFDLKAGRDFYYNSVDGVIKIANSSRIYLRELKANPSDPEFSRIGSTAFTFAFVDEAQEITTKACDAIRSRLRYRVEEFGLSGQLLMSCNPAKNFLYSEFYRPFISSTLPPHQKFVPALVTDNTYIAHTYVEKLENMKDESMKQRLLYGNWDYTNTTNQLVLQQWIDTALIDIAGTQGPMRIGVDIAREGDDKTVIALWKKVGEFDLLQDLKLIDILITEQTDVSGKIADAIISYASAHKIGYNDIHVDAVGVGGGVIDALRARGWFIKSYKGGAAVNIREQFTEYRNLRSYSYWKFRVGIQENKVKINKNLPYVEELKREFTAHEYQINEKTVILEEKEKVKKKIGKSPDFADASVIGLAPNPQPEFIVVTA